MTGNEAYDYLCESQTDRLRNTIVKAANTATNRIKFSDLPGNGPKPLPPNKVYLPFLTYENIYGNRRPIVITDSATETLDEAREFKARFEEDPKSNFRRAGMGGAAVGGLGGAAIGGVVGGYANATKDILAGLHEEKQMKKDNASEEDIKSHRKNMYKKAAKSALKGAGYGAAMGLVTGGGIGYATNRANSENNYAINKKRFEKAIRNKFGDDTKITWEN